jgi:hypothetical protein
MVGRPSSVSSEAETYDEKHTPNRSSAESSFIKPRDEEDLEMGKDVEMQELLPAEEKAPEAAAPPAPGSSARSAIIWMGVNTLATIGIVSCVFDRCCIQNSSSELTPHLRSLQTRPSSRTLL